MIRFACPRCKAVLERQEQAASSTFPCPGCGQILQAPCAAEIKAAPENLPGPESGGAKVETIPIKPFGAFPLDDAGSPPPYVTARPGAAKVPASPRPAEDFPTPPPLPAARRRRLDRDDDSFEDDVADIERYSGRNAAGQAMTARSAATGFICSLAGLGMLFVDLLMWVYMIQTHQGREAQPLFFIMLLLDLVGFVLGIVGIVFGSRGIEPSNHYNRGLGVAGLVLGIIAVVISSIAGLFLLCVGTLIMAGPW